MSKKTPHSTEPVVEWREDPPPPPGAFSPTLGETLEAMDDLNDAGDGFGDLLDLLDAIEESESGDGLSTVQASAQQGEIGAVPPAEDGGFEDDGFDDGEDEDDEWLHADLDEGATEQANYRKLFETEYHSKTVDERVAIAQSAIGPVLSAMCYDPEPRVIHAIFQNPNVGLEQARLVANHHRNPAGLNHLGNRADFLRDPQIKRLLCRNQQSSEVLLRKMLRSLPLIRLYRLRNSGENTDRAKTTMRLLLREKFQAASGEAKAGLIYNTEARCLGLLVGLGFCGKTTATLCRRTYNSSIMIQNLLRFPGTPPQLIKHLSRQQTVRRAPHLRRLILQHSNCPSDIKRGGSF